VQGHGVAPEGRQQRLRLSTWGFGRFGFLDEEVHQEGRDGARQRVGDEQQRVRARPEGPRERLESPAGAIQSDATHGPTSPPAALVPILIHVNR
jgi:hypothetical protein